MESLESAKKVLGKKRKTILYYKKLVKEAGMDYTRVGQMTRQRKEWKKRVNIRMKHLDLGKAKRKTEQRRENTEKQQNTCAN